MRSSHRGPASAVTLLLGLARIVLPLLVIAAAAYWFLNFYGVGKGMVRVSTSIPGAEILVGGILTGTVSDTTIEVPAGKQIITVRKDSYVSEPEFAVVDVSRHETSRVRFTLKPAQEAVTQDSVAPLRPVRQDIFSTGVPFRSVSPGSYHQRRVLDVTQHNSEPDDRTDPNPAAFRTESSGVAPLTSSSSDLPAAPLSSTQITVSSNPDGAQILVNGQPSSHVTPYTFRGLDRGVYSFRVKQDGFVARPESISVTLTTDFQRELAAFELSPDPTLPQPALTISTGPLAAGFTVDGKPGGVGKASLNPGFGQHRIEFAEVPGFKTPAPVTVSLTAEQPHAEASGVYERLTGNAFIAVLPSEDLEKFDGKQLRIYVDNELILDGPKQRFDATLLGHLLSGKRLIRIQYGDLSTDTFLNLTDNEVIEITFRVETFFSKRKLRLRDKPIVPIEQWQQNSKKMNVLSVT
ncbi:MAG TPA: PEGA domain-containing protein [bacterium]|jgi:hypothetical protein